MGAQGDYSNVSKRFSRRNLMQYAGAASVASMTAPQVAKAATASWPIDVMGGGIPKICAYAGNNAAANRALQQVGVFHVIGGGGGGMPWTEDGIRRNITRMKEQGMT